MAYGGHLSPITALTASLQQVDDEMNLLERERQETIGDPVLLENAVNDCFEQLMDSVILGFAFEVHRNAKLGMGEYGDVIPRNIGQNVVHKPGVDIFGLPPMIKSPACPCPVCKSKCNASRFTKHLNKCWESSSPMGTTQRTAENGSDTKKRVQKKNKPAYPKKTHRAKKSVEKKRDRIDRNTELANESYNGVTEGSALGYVNGDANRTNYQDQAEWTNSQTTKFPPEEWITFNDGFNWMDDEWIGSGMAQHLENCWERCSSPSFNDDFNWIDEKWIASGMAQQLENCWERCSPISPTWLTDDFIYNGTNVINIAQEENVTACAIKQNQRANTSNMPKAAKSDKPKDLPSRESFNDGFNRVDGGWIASGMAQHLENCWESSSPIPTTWLTDNYTYNGTNAANIVQEKKVTACAIKQNQKANKSKIPKAARSDKPKKQGKPSGNRRKHTELANKINTGITEGSGLSNVDDDIILTNNQYQTERMNVETAKVSPEGWVSLVQVDEEYLRDQLGQFDTHSSDGTPPSETGSLFTW